MSLAETSSPGTSKIPWHRLFLAAFGLNMVVVAILRDSRVTGCCPA